MLRHLPTSCIAGSWAALPQAGWAQIVCLIAILDNSLFAQDPNREPGDVVRATPASDACAFGSVRAAADAALA